ncbi:OPT family oligopeptide transporter [Hathewaya massiliensis]|uniref:OPT family oligopeptide transporter n=1 Tax=Hathewaya massiliensis TaxID=1964382 RepID=UPI0011594EB5|nr:oligopeptide transporter, OPT family [Hathewaya massiliensis]
MITEKKGLSKDAYGGIKGEDYVPYISVDSALPELTAVSVILGCVLAIVFGVANTYLGLKVGMTIAAGIPAAILSTSILKSLFKRNNILETNIIQAMASMGESLAGGLIFIIPAVIVLGNKLTITMTILVSLFGGALGILFVLPLRKYLTVEEHGKLVYPEGMAAAEVLVNSSAGGEGFKNMMTGLLGGGLYKFLSGALGLWVESPVWTIKSFHGTVFGIDAMASLIGVGYIVGIKIAMYMFSGAIVANYVLVPLIKYFGAGNTMALYPAADLISKMSAPQISSSYVKYIGAGAVAAGGFISIAKALPVIFSSFKSALGGLKSKTNKSTGRTDKDLPITWVIGAAILVFVLSIVLPMINTGVVGSLLAIVFSFFFAVVSARIVGLIGSSNNPISGMTIASLLFIAAALKAMGKVDNTAMLAAILAGSIVCVAVAVAGGSAQASKTSYVLGGTPKNLQIAMYIAIVASCAVIGGVILMLDKAYGLGSPQVPAPQANLMAMIVKGVMSGQLPWTLVITGMMLAIMCELMNIPVLPFALGLYLPINLSAGVLVGAIIRVVIEKKFKKDPKKLETSVEKGVLTASGMVAGDALMGILIAIFAYAGLTDKIAIGTKISESIATSPWTAAIVMVLGCIAFFKYTSKVEG